MVVEYYGAQVGLPVMSERLILSFSPGQLPLKQRWRNNGLSADFMGDYVTAFFPRDDGEPSTARRQAEIKGAVTYIANELLENAMKYHDESSTALIELTLEMGEDKLIFRLRHAVTIARLAVLREFIARLTASDADTLYMEQLEENAMSAQSSGLGLLTMINDYNADIAWQFESVAEMNWCVGTQVCMPI
ncbi:MAG: ATP-binding protein [Sulfuriferula sp.]|nr:ATP-binding protein [Sulfuriferula sp.]